MPRLIESTARVHVERPATGFDVDPAYPILVRINGADPVPATRDAERQIADHCGIPWGYFERLRHEAPALLAATLNFWLHTHPTKRLVTIEGGALAGFSSPKKKKPC